MEEEPRDPKREYEIKNDYSYATGRARALEARIREPQAMGPEQAIREYGIGEDIDARLEELMDKSLQEFEDSAPEAVLPFRLMADLSNLKAFIRSNRTGEKIPYSPLGSIKPPKSSDGLKASLTDSGHQALADKSTELLSMDLEDADLFLESYFVGKITNQLFLEYISLKKSYLKSAEKPEEFYERLETFAKENSVTKNMDSDVPTAFLILKQRELTLAREKALSALMGD